MLAEQQRRYEVDSLLVSYWYILFGRSESELNIDGCEVNKRTLNSCSGIIAVQPPVGVDSNQEGT